MSTDSFRLVPVTIKSTDIVSAFMQIGGAYLQEMGRDTPDTAEKFLLSILRKQGESDRWLVMLEHDGCFIGFVHAKIDREERPGWGYIMEFYIIPEHRRRGWGRRMFNHIAALLQRREVSSVWLTSHRMSESFWTSLGFTATGEEEHGLRIFAADTVWRQQIRTVQSAVVTKRQPPECGS